MTDYYVGNDPEFWTLMMEKEQNLLFESFDKTLRAEHMAGPGGTRLKRNIDEAIADGRLPREFRGEAGSHLRKEMIRNLVESGQRESSPDHGRIRAARRAGDRASTREVWREAGLPLGHSFQVIWSARVGEFAWGLAVVKLAVLLLE
jgi:hypothetical protein